MRSYLVSRVLGMVPTLAVISVIIFTVIQLPEGDIVSSTLDRLQARFAALVMHLGGLFMRDHVDEWLSRHWKAFPDKGDERGPARLVAL